MRNSKAPRKEITEMQVGKPDCEGGSCKKTKERKYGLRLICFIMRFFIVVNIKRCFAKKKESLCGRRLIKFNFISKVILRKMKPFTGVIHCFGHRIL